MNYKSDGVPGLPRYGSGGYGSGFMLWSRQQGVLMRRGVPHLFGTETEALMHKTKGEYFVLSCEVIGPGSTYQQAYGSAYGPEPLD